MDWLNQDIINLRFYQKEIKGCTCCDGRDSNQKSFFISFSYSNLFLIFFLE